MGVLLERAVAALSVALAACSVTAADSLPASQAENASAAHFASGQVRAGADSAATLLALEIALRADASQRWGQAPAAGLKAASAEVAWADGSLGCPRPGQAYTQALEPGWRVVISAPGRQSTYHASRSGRWVLCESVPPARSTLPRTVDR